MIHLRERGLGGGRLSISKKYKDIKEALEKLVADSTFGSPEQPLLWTTKSLRNLESELQSLGYQISYRTVGMPSYPKIHLRAKFPFLVNVRNLVFPARFFYN